MTTHLDLTDMAAQRANPFGAQCDMDNERRQLYRELAQSAQEVRLLDKVLAAVTSSSDQDELIRTMGFGIKELLPYERWSRVSLALLDDKQQELQIYQLIGERNNPFWDNVGKGIQAAAQELGVEAIYAMATMHSDVSQEMLIDQAIGDGISGIALAPADAEALEPAIRRARQAGIPLITFATPSIEQSAALLDIGTDDLRAGSLAGQAMARLLPTGGKVGTSIYSPDQINMRQRIQGFQVVTAGTAIDPLPPFAIHDDRELGFRLGCETLAAQPDLAGAFGAASLNGPIWARVIAAAQRTQQVKIVGFDLVPATIAMLKEGSIHATIAQREHAMGYRSVQLLSQMIVNGVEATLASQPVSRFVDTGVDVVTLERTPWSIALADYLKRPSDLTNDRALADAVARHGKPIKLLLIGILPGADPDIARQNARLQPGSLVGQVLVAERSLVVNPLLDDTAAFAEARARGARTLVGVPLLAERRVVGVLTLESAEADACMPEDLAMIERVANAVVVALENARLFRQAIERRRSIEEAAQRQELLLQTILDLSSPVASIVPGILVMPLVGVIDTQRARRFNETLLAAISARRTQVVLIDITGVSLVDTSVANSILQAAQSARLLGAEVVLVGITPAVAETIVHLGIGLAQIITRADLESGFGYALARLKGRIIFSESTQASV
jgi:ABC-type sugar transport system substrate-binding protein/anti-anti-sigma regulatory factor